MKLKTNTFTCKAHPSTAERKVNFIFIKICRYLLLLLRRITTVLPCSLGTNRVPYPYLAEKCRCSHCQACATIASSWG